jgi:hypothetical protein
MWSAFGFTMWGPSTLDDLLSGFDGHEFVGADGRRPHRRRPFGPASPGATPGSGSLRSAATPWSTKSTTRSPAERTFGRCRRFAAPAQLLV